MYLPVPKNTQGSKVLGWIPSVGVAVIGSTSPEALTAVKSGLLE